MPDPTQQGIAGSDESFISFAFAIVSLVCLCVYLPLLVRLIKFIIDFAIERSTGSSEKKKNKFEDDDQESPVLVIYGYISYVPKVILFFIQNPGCLTEGIQVCMKEKSLTAFVCFPRVFKFIFRPKVFILWLWFILFTSAMYSTLTFDAYGILGIPATSTEREIKKAYRKLTKVNHPDHNKTEAARNIYTNVRKAYKSLVDKEAYEAEMQQEEQMSFGVALPRFMTSRDNDALVLFGLLAVLVGVPLLIWWKFKGSDNDRLKENLETITTYEERVEGFLLSLGVPQDVKFLEKRRSRAQVLVALKAVGLATADMNETAVETFPGFLEFKNRCLNLDKFRAALTALGFDDEGLKLLNEYFVSNPEIGIELETPLVQQEFVKVETNKFKTTKFMLEQLTNHINASATAIDELFKVELRSTRRIRNHHRDVLEMITVLYERDKQYQNNVQSLMEAPRRGDELCKELPLELNALFKKMQQRYLQEQGYGTAKQQKKMMQQQQRMQGGGGYNKGAQE